MGPPRICFATFEVSPFTGGGIGTWLRNTLDAYSGRGAQFEVVYYGADPIDPIAFAKRFPGVIFRGLDMTAPWAEAMPTDGPLFQSGLDTISQWRSYVLAMALKHLERTTGAYSVIERPSQCAFTARRACSAPPSTEAGVSRISC